MRGDVWLNARGVLRKPPIPKSGTFILSFANRGLPKLNGWPAMRLPVWAYMAGFSCLLSPRPQFFLLGKIFYAELRESISRKQGGKNISERAPLARPRRWLRKTVPPWR